VEVFSVISVELRLKTVRLHRCRGNLDPSFRLMVLRHEEQPSHGDTPNIKVDGLGEMGERVPSTGEKKGCTPGGSRRRGGRQNIKTSQSPSPAGTREPEDCTL
jgi:hypothetical protein